MLLLLLLLLLLGRHVSQLSGNGASLLDRGGTQDWPDFSDGPRAATRCGDRRERPLNFSDSLLQPIRAFRLHYVPLLMVYFAYGALGLIDVSRDMWIKESLTLSPAELAGIGVWLALPWTVKMVFGELVDTVPIFGSQRRSYILHRRDLHRERVAHARRRGRRMAHLHAPAPALSAGRAADRARHRHPGRGRRRHVDRGGRARRRRGPAAAGRRT